MYFPNYFFDRNQQNTKNPFKTERKKRKKKKNILAFHTPCREKANPHIVHYKLYISLVLFSVMAATPDTGEQFRIKLPGVDSSGV